MKLTLLGTGNAVVTKCYNTCFVIEDNKKAFLIDGGGGNTLLNQLTKVDIDWRSIRDIFVTHKHIDHLIGIIWMIRMICQSIARNQYEGEARIYAHKEVIDLLYDISNKLLPSKHTKYIGNRLHLIEVNDGEEKKILDHKITFFDINSTKAKQYGFTFELDNGEKLSCCGDEPFNENNINYVKDSKWLLHEAFCLYSQKEKYKPYEKNHSTVKDACEIAKELNIKNLVLYHTEDDNYENRKEIYMQEGKKYFNGNLYVPYDLEYFEI